jgi:hypothetical protein
MTHKMIKSKFIRRMYAEELLAFRRLPISVRKEDFFQGTLFGMESAFWKLEQVLR